MMVISPREFVSERKSVLGIQFAKLYYSANQNYFRALIYLTVKAAQLSLRLLHSLRTRNVSQFMFRQLPVQRRFQQDLWIQCKNSPHPLSFSRKKIKKWSFFTLALVQFVYVQWEWIICLRESSGKRGAFTNNLVMGQTFCELQIWKVGCI